MPPGKGHGQQTGRSAQGLRRTDSPRPLHMSRREFAREPICPHRTAHDAPDRNTNQDGNGSGGPDRGSDGSGGRAALPRRHGRASLPGCTAVDRPDHPACGRRPAACTGARVSVASGAAGPALPGAWLTKGPGIAFGSRTIGPAIDEGAGRRMCPVSAPVRLRRKGNRADHGRGRG